MKKGICSLFIILISVLSLSSCEEFISKGFDNETIKKLRSENTSLKIQADRLQTELKQANDIVLTKDVIIFMYDLRHGVERYAASNNGEFPTAQNVTELIKVITPYLPKDFTAENRSLYMETVKSTSKGYIFIANVNAQKIVVSNLI